MQVLSSSTKLDWRCRRTWQRASYNTMWCLIGCSIGDFGTIAFFQVTEIAWPTLLIMMLAIFNGLITSIILETIILARQMPFSLALKTAFGMSLISMISMEAAMNIVDVWLTGGAMLTWWVIPLMLTAGFITPLPYNYWRLKALGKACHWFALIMSINAEMMSTIGTGWTIIFNIIYPHVWARWC